MAGKVVIIFHPLITLCHRERESLRVSVIKVEHERCAYSYEFQMMRIFVIILRELVFFVGEEFEVDYLSLRARFSSNLHFSHHFISTCSRLDE